MPPDEGEMVKHHTDPTDTNSVSEAEKAAREKIRELINMGHGSRTGRLKSWSEKVSTLADKLIELGDVTHVMEQNDAVTDENIMFSDVYCFFFIKLLFFIHE